jgi:hypothetical protein
MLEESRTRIAPDTPPVCVVLHHFGGTPVCSGRELLHGSCLLAGWNGAFRGKKCKRRHTLAPVHVSCAQMVLPHRAVSC